MKSIKRIFALCIILSMLVVVMVLTSCNVTGMVSNDVEAMMDEVLTGDDYTVEYKSENDIYCTLKVTDGQMYYSVKMEGAICEYYLYCDEDTDKYYYARVWKYGEKNKGEEKVEITKDEYVAAYLLKYNQYSCSEQVFKHRYILEMAKHVGGDRYEYSREFYSENSFAVTKYSIDIKNNSLVLLTEHTENVGEGEKEESGETIKILTEKTTYSNIGDTEIEIPNKILNMDVKGNYLTIMNSESSIGLPSVEEEETPKACVHTFGEWKISENASCAKDGEQGRSCTECGEKETETIKATGKHEFRAWELVTAATCTEAGEEERLCFYCTHKETRDIPALGHKEINVEYTAPSCIKDGCEEGKKCEVCDEVIEGCEVLEALGHDLTFYEAVDPTCTESGHKAYEECSKCDHSTYEELPSPGHDFSAGDKCAHCDTWLNP